MQACILIIPSFYINPLYHRKSVKYLKWSSCYLLHEKKKKKPNKIWTHHIHMTEYCSLTKVSSHAAEKQSIWRGSHSLSIRDEDITFFFFLGEAERSTLTTCFSQASSSWKFKPILLMCLQEKKKKKKDLQYHQRERVKRNNECSTAICEKTNTVKHSRTMALE